MVSLTPFYKSHRCMNRNYFYFLFIISLTTIQTFQLGSFYSPSCVHGELGRAVHAVLGLCCRSAGWRRRGFKLSEVCVEIHLWFQGRSSPESSACHCNSWKRLWECGAKILQQYSHGGVLLRDGTAVSDKQGLWFGAFNSVFPLVKEWTQSTCMNTNLLNPE